MGYGRLVRRYLDPLLSKLLALLQNGKRIVQEQASARWGPRNEPRPHVGMCARTCAFVHSVRPHF
jgi:hypothetical protein